MLTDCDPNMQGDYTKTCVVGAGCAGLATAWALLAAGLDFDLFERNSDIGGNWTCGVYDSTYLISSRKTSGYLEFPMPETYPDFPSRLQVRDYLQAYAERFDLRSQINFGQEVTSLRSVGDEAATRWQVTTATGIERIYDSVVVANGHLWDKVVPRCVGTFSGKQVHSRDYRSVADISGRRVLIVGAGNSGCDLVADAAFAGLDVTLSMRRGHWFLPKTLFGVPRGELFIGKLPKWPQRPLLSWLSYIVLGSRLNAARLRAAPAASDSALLPCTAFSRITSSKMASASPAWPSLRSAKARRHRSVVRAANSATAAFTLAPNAWDAAGKAFPVGASTRSRSSSSLDIDWICRSTSRSSETLACSMDRNRAWWRGFSTARL